MLQRANVTLTLIAASQNRFRLKKLIRIASALEKETKEHFANTVVTVHIEPKCN